MSNEPIPSTIHEGMLFCDRYRIEHHLAEGGMGTIYLATDENSGLPVAIKVLFPHYSDNTVLRARFLDEGRIQAMLQHPNIVHVYRVITEPILSFVMEFVDGDTLEQYLQREDVISEVEVIDLILPVMSAVGFAHNKGIIHRDLKPSNVLLKNSSGYREPKVMDFGVAKVDRKRQLTAAGTTVGTLHYMSPEQIVGASNIDGRADIYSLGCTMYKLCTGEVPFNASSEFALMMAQVEAPPTPPRTLRPDLSTAMEKIILRALAKEPESRFQTIREMTSALMRLAAPDENRDTDTRPIPKDILEFAMAADEVALDQTSQYRLEYLAAGGVPQEVVETSDYEPLSNLTHELSGTAVRKIASDRLKAAQRKSGVTNRLDSVIIKDEDNADPDQTREAPVDQVTTQPRNPPQAAELRATTEHRKRPARELRSTDKQDAVDLEDMPTGERDTKNFPRQSRRGVVAVDKGVDSQEVTSLRTASAFLRDEGAPDNSSENTAVQTPSALRRGTDSDATSDELPSSRFPPLKRGDDIATNEVSSDRFPRFIDDDDEDSSNTAEERPKRPNLAPVEESDRTADALPSHRSEPSDKSPPQLPSARNLPPAPPKNNDAGSVRPLQQRMSDESRESTRKSEPSDQPSSSGQRWLIIGALAFVLAFLILLWAVFLA